MDQLKTKFPIALLLLSLAASEARAGNPVLQRKVDVALKPGCACSTACTDKGDKSWCWTDATCDLADSSLKGYSRACDPAVEKARQQKADVLASHACGCSSVCTDKGKGSSWCYTSSGCKVSVSGNLGFWRSCDAAVELKREQDGGKHPGCAQKDWTAFRDGLLQYGLQPGTVGPAVKECKESKAYTSATLDQKNKFEACLGRAEKLSSILLRPDLGLSKTTVALHDEYKDTALKVPALLADQELFTLLQRTNLSRLDSVERVVKKIKALYRDAIVLPYISPSTASIDKPDTYGRIIVWVEDAGVSRYVQFSVNAKPTDLTSNRFQASVVNLDPKVEGGKAFIFDWTRSTPNTHKFEFKSGAGQNGQTCYQCHMDGVLAVHRFWPKHRAQFPETADSLGDNSDGWLEKLNLTYDTASADLNHKMEADNLKYKGVAFAPARDLPGLNAPVPNPLGTPKDSAACSLAERQAVETLRTSAPGGKACVACHTGNIRDNPVYADGALNAMVDKYIRLGYMPPGNTADQATRNKAADCFVNAYSRLNRNSILVNWLKGSACR